VRSGAGGGVRAAEAARGGAPVHLRVVRAAAGLRRGGTGVRRTRAVGRRRVRAGQRGRRVIPNKRSTVVESTNRIRAYVWAFTLDVSHAGTSDLGPAIALKLSAVRTDPDYNLEIEGLFTQGS